MPEPVYYMEYWKEIFKDMIQSLNKNIRYLMKDSMTLLFIKYPFSREFDTSKFITITITA